MSTYHTILSRLNATPAAGNTPTADAVYFLGIGGIGMSALARYFLSLGVRVSGYDRTSTPLTQQLEQEGMLIHYTDDVSRVDRDAQVVVWTPAIPKDHQELNFLRDNGYLLVKRSEVLGAVINAQFSICIAGTHGKTTTSSLVAHVLRDSGYGCNAFLGGIASNYQANFWTSPNPVAVAEADEYDRSFLRLFPDMAVISSMDADHLDIYGTHDALEQAFIQFTKQIKPDGFLLSKYGLPQTASLVASTHWTYSGAHAGADCHPTHLRVVNGAYRFDVQLPDTTITDVELAMGGRHNVENAIAAIAIAHRLGIEADKIRAAIASFRGVKRRFEYIHRDAASVMIDDYAHHPGELEALIQGVRELYPDRKLTLVFQPHLYSRTRDFADGFAEALSKADEVYLLPIYPARELPMEGVNTEMIAARMSHPSVYLLSKEAWLEQCEKWRSAQQVPAMLVTAGAGDIDALVPSTQTILYAS